MRNNTDLFTEHPYITELCGKDITKKKWWDTLQEEKMPYFIFTYSPVCGVCHDIQNWFDNLSRSYYNRVHFASINGFQTEDGNDKILVQWEIGQIPTFVWINPDYPKRLERITGGGDPTRLYNFFIQQLTSYYSETI